MFAPPDPTVPRTDLPDPTDDAARKASAAPTLADPATGAPAFAPTLPGPVASPTQSPPRSTTPVASPAPGTQTSDRTSARDDRPPAPRPLFRSGWLRRLSLWATAGSVPALFVGDAVGVGFAVVSVLTLILWSGVVALNVRRARPATRHGRSPNPVAVMLAWLVGPLVAVAGGLIVEWVSTWVDAGTFAEEGNRTLVLAGTVFVVIVAVLFATFLPFRALARCSRWVNADPGRFWKWFVAPIVAGLLAVVAQVFAGLVALSDGVGGTPGGATIGAVALWLLSFTLPWLAWLFFASRAMRSLEAGVTHAHGRSAREALDPGDVDPRLIGQGAAAAAGVSALSA